MKQYGKYYAVLVGLYILVSHGSDSGALFTAGANGASGFTKALEGRS